QEALCLTFHRPCAPRQLTCRLVNSMINFNGHAPRLAPWTHSSAAPARIDATRTARSAALLPPLDACLRPSPGLRGARGDTAHVSHNRVPVPCVSGAHGREGRSSSEFCKG